MNSQEVWRPKKYKGEFNGAASGSGTEYSATSTMDNATTVFDGDATSYASQAMNSGSYQTITTAPLHLQADHLHITPTMVAQQVDQTTVT